MEVTIQKTLSTVSYITYIFYHKCYICIFSIKNKWIYLFVIIDLCILEWSSSLFIKVIDFHMKIRWWSWENFAMLHVEQWRIHILYCLNHLSFIWLQRYKHLSLSDYIIYNLNYTFMCEHLLLNIKIFCHILLYLGNSDNNLLGVDLLLINIKMWSTTSFNQGHTY